MTFLGEEQAAKTVILNTIMYANVFFIYIFRQFINKRQRYIFFG